MSAQPIESTGVRVDLCTRREGLLSRVGHDLRFRARAIHLTLGDDGALRVVIPADAIGVVAVRTPGGDDTARPSASDRATIEKHLRDDVLAARQHPEVTATGTVHATASGVRFDGALTLRGTQRPVRLSLAPTAHGALAGTHTLSTTAFGIPPFRAMMGALRVADDVVVEVTVDATAAERLAAALAVAPGQGS